MRGKEVAVTCEQCGRRVARVKAVSYEKPVSFGTDIPGADNVRFFEKKRVYYCISCGKHRGIFEKKREQAERARKF